MSNQKPSSKSIFIAKIATTILYKVIEMDTAIKKADEKLTFISTDKEALRLYHMREMALSDWTSGINNAKREGRQEGRIEIAAKMLSDNKSTDEIIKYTDLTEKEIDEIRTKLKTRE